MRSPKGFEARFREEGYSVPVGTSVRRPKKTTDHATTMSEATPKKSTSKPKSKAASGKKSAKVTGKPAANTKKTPSDKPAPKSKAAKASTAKKGKKSADKPKKAVAARKPSARSADPMKVTPPAGSRRKSATAKDVGDSLVMPSDEQIAVAAYFLSEKRKEAGAPDDPLADWLAARSQLEVGRTSDAETFLA